MDRLSYVINKIEEASNGKKGIQFYSHKEHTYIFIETTEPQRFKIKCAIHPRKELIVIPRALVETEEEYVDALNL